MTNATHDQSVPVEPTPLHHPEKTPTTMMCCVCAATRTTKQTVITPDRRLKCAVCGCSTKHLTTETAPTIGDWREATNAANGKSLASLMWLESVYQDLGIHVREKGPDSDLGGALFGLAHEMRDGQHCWEFQISSQASIDGRIAALRHALRCMVDGEGGTGEAWHEAKRSRWTWPARTPGHLVSENHD